MSVTDTLDYVTLRNPISRLIISSGGAVLRSIGLKPKNAPAAVSNQVGKSAQLPPILAIDTTLAKLAGSHYHFVRLGGISGALAIIMGAYCKYHIRAIDDPKMQLEAQALSDVANRIHFLHSFMLVAVPIAHKPVLTGSLITIGTALFSGSMYYRALSDDKSLQHLATAGGFFLIAAWLSLVV